jgi:UDP-N-acetylmuramoylalanine--D-glutamate ligase
VLWVNDSKATNVTATAVALRSFDRPVVLILGGRHKGEPYSGLVPDLQQRARAVVAFGEAAPRILSDLGGSVGTLRVESGLDAVVRAAAELAQPGDVVLLSPACSSYDMFPDYRERGRAFAEVYRELPPGLGSAV